MIYLDQAATSFPKIKEVQDAVIDCMNKCTNANRSTSTTSLNASRLIYQTRKLVKEYFHVPQEGCVVLNSGNTESLNTCIKGIVKKGDHVITTYAEHNSVLRPLYQLEKANIITLSITSPTVENIKKHLQKNTKMIIVTHSSNVTGEIYPITEIGKLAHEHDILMMSDVAQSAGHLPIDMEKMNLDILCFSGHKGLLGNSGIGGFCLRHTIEIEPLISGGTGIDSFNHFQSDYYPEHAEAGTRNMTGIASLKAGVSYLMKYQDEKSVYTNELIDLLYKGLKSIPQVILYGDFKERTPILAFNIKGMDSFQVADLLNNQYDIAIRCGTHCAPLMHQHLNTVESGLVRVSPAFMNTKEEIQFFIQAIQEISEGNYDN